MHITAFVPCLHLLFSAPTTTAIPSVTLTHDAIQITRSVRIRPGRYIITDRGGKGVVQVAADNVTVDFQGAHLLSCPDPAAAAREGFTGVGVSIAGHKNVTLKNAVIEGYQFNIRVQDSSRVNLENCRVNYSRAQKLLQNGQTIDRFLNVRSAEAWRDYGAGLWLENVTRSIVRGCRGSGANDGLILLHCRGCTAAGNDFSFNSAFGVGLSGSSDNVICWNRLDFVNRPWSGGWGADSAGMVVTDGSCRNVVVGNSLTHGGDGFFLTDRVNGGFDPKTKTFRFAGSCNDNTVSGNDGSWSPNNAFEGTFSYRNVYQDNRADNSGYGFWLGFSDGSGIFDSDISRNRANGIAIGQGAGTRIEGNHLAGNGNTAIAVWSDEGPGLATHPSADTEIFANVIQNSPRAVDLARSDDYGLWGNVLSHAPLPPGLRADKPVEFPTARQRFLASAPYKRVRQILAARPKDFQFYRATGGPQGAEWLQPDTYGPRDFRGHLFAWRRVDPGTVEVASLTPTPLRARVPAWLTASGIPGRPPILRLQARSAPNGVGEENDAAIPLLARNGQRETLNATFRTLSWDTRWWRWAPPLAYTDAPGWAALFASPPAARRAQREIAITLGGPPLPAGLPLDHVAMIATTTVRLTAGTYKFSTLSDDGVRLFVDGQETISRWNHHGATPDEATVPLSAGPHQIRVQYCQEDGGAVLQLNWARQEQSGGEPAR